MAHPPPRQASRVNLHDSERQYERASGGQRELVEFHLLRLVDLGIDEMEGTAEFHGDMDLAKSHAQSRDKPYAGVSGGKSRSVIQFPLDDRKTRTWSNPRGVESCGTAPTKEKRNIQATAKQRLQLFPVRSRPSYEQQFPAQAQRQGVRVLFVERKRVPTIETNGSTRVCQSGFVGTGDAHARRDPRCHGWRDGLVLYLRFGRDLRGIRCAGQVL